jgi:hypothetical protein
MKDHISSLDIKGEDITLDLDEVEKFHSLSIKKISLARISYNTHWQKSIMSLLKEGDANI